MALEELEEMILLTTLLIVISGAAEAVMDTLQFHYDRSLFVRLPDQSFWRPDLSWKNKWKEGDPQLGERFLGSSTLFVGLTDAWHLFKSIHNVALFLGLFGTAVIFREPVSLAIAFIVARVTFGLSFTLAFRLLKL